MDRQFLLFIVLSVSIMSPALSQSSLVDLASILSASSGRTVPLRIGATINFRQMYDTDWTALQSGALTFEQATADPEYESMLLNNYDYITVENRCKWRYEDSTSYVDYAPCEFASNYSQQHGLGFRHHAAVWGQDSSLPEDLQRANYDDDAQSYTDHTVAELITLLEERVTDVMTKYPDASAYDIVNEPLCDCNWMAGDLGQKCATKYAYATNVDDDSLGCGYDAVLGVWLKKNTFWPKVPDYIQRSLIAARSANANAKIGINEYKHECARGFYKYNVNGNGQYAQAWQGGNVAGFLGDKGTMMKTLVDALIFEGVPLDYIGSQSHIDTSYNWMISDDGLSPSVQYAQCVLEYGQWMVSRGLQFEFTEITIDTLDESVSELSDQEDLFVTLLDACIQLGDACETFQVWGVSDKYETTNRTYHDTANNPKAAVQALATRLQ